jgi:hypothetical protein
LESIWFQKRQHLGELWWFIRKLFSHPGKAKQEKIIMNPPLLANIHKQSTQLCPKRLHDVLRHSPNMLIAVFLMKNTSNHQLVLASAHRRGIKSGDRKALLESLDTAD